MTLPLCFIIMPFGRKPTSGGRIIDFDAIYEELIVPAVKGAELEPLRADLESAGGIIHKPMYERLILCKYAVADLTTANANVFYELGLRHAVRRKSTVLLFAKDTGQLPFDLSPLRALPYNLGKDGRPADVAVANDRKALERRLRAARGDVTDSPIFQLVEEFPDIQRLKTDVFRDRVEYSESVKKQLFEARHQKDAQAVQAVADSLGCIADQESGVVIDLYLSYRAVEAFDAMLALVDQMAPPLAATVMVQEQLGFALNRVGRRKEAETVLKDLIASRGPSSETYGILGRVYKDAWEAAAADGDDFLATGYLDKAVEAYLKGFEADWRDAYPGINAVTLMEIRDPPDPRRHKLIPIVAYAVERRMAAGEPDYWDYATKLELRVLAGDERGAAKALSGAMAAGGEDWQRKTTINNLRIIGKARKSRGDVLDWATKIEKALLKCAML
jgi:tetratricopeptide (TPR) repeat protein